MAELLPDDVREQLRERLVELKAPVRLVHFTPKHACSGCAQQRELLEAIAALSEKHALEVYELVDDALVAERFGVNKVPATAVVGERGGRRARLRDPPTARGWSASPTSSRSSAATSAAT
jgi:hypothetical protein